MDAGSVAVSGILAASLAFIAFAFLFAIAMYVVSAYFMSKVFAKAGVEGEWRAWVPVYNMMVFLKIGDLSPWLVLYGFGGAIVLSWLDIGFIFSLALWVVTGLAAYRVGRKLGAEPAMVALWIIPVVWLIVMANRKEPWTPQIEAASWKGNAFLEDRTDWEGVPAQSVAAA